MIIFSNDGEMDIKAVTVFGLSVKESKSAIGRFGTGLKYAIAVVLRNGGSVVIASGEDVYSFETQSEEFRGEKREFVYIRKNDEARTPLGFTIDLGRDWEDWQAFREFYANNIDENGQIAHRDSGRPDPVRGQTIISVEHRPFDAIFYSLEEHFIGSGEDPIWENDELAIYPGRCTQVFYQGIRIYTLKKPALYRYNFKKYIELTEDRTAKYYWQILLRLHKNLPLCTDQEICDAILKPNAEFERDLKYAEDFEGDPSSQFVGAVVNGKSAPMSASQIVRLSLPEDDSKFNLLQPAQSGSEQLSEAISIAQDAGLSKEGVKFVLGHGLPVVGDYDIRKKNLILSESIVEDQDKMNVAVVCGLAELQAGSRAKKFVAELLIKKTTKERALD